MSEGGQALNRLVEWLLGGDKRGFGVRRSHGRRIHVELRDGDERSSALETSLGAAVDKALARRRTGQT